MCAGVVRHGYGSYMPGVGQRVWSDGRGIRAVHDPELGRDDSFAALEALLQATHVRPPPIATTDAAQRPEACIVSVLPVPTCA